MSLFDEMAADAPELLAEVGRDVIIDGITTKAVVGAPVESEVLADGGFIVQVTIEVKLLRAGLVSVPEKGSKLTFNGVVVRIKSISDHPPYPWVVLTCQHEHQ
jgi:hypothetical protein